MWPTPSGSSAFVARRARLDALLKGMPALVAAGSPPARNYPANRYPFRASSHFLYLVGRAIPGAVLGLDATGPALFVPDPAPDDAMWHGPARSRERLADELGLTVRSLRDLPSAVQHHAEAVATLSPNDDITAAALTSWLGRSIAPRAGATLTHGSADARLADALVALRLHHDDAAILQLRQAARATAEAHAIGLRRTVPLAREAEVAAAMLAAMSASGMGPAYEPIVTVHGEVLHNPHYDHVLAAGDLLLADVGAETPEGFAGDVTRVWPVGGRFSPTQRAIYEVVLAAQERAIAMVTPGTRYRAIHQAAARAIVEGLVELGILRGDVEDLTERGAHAVFFPHGVGHLIGADVHDMEDLGDRAGYAPGRTRSARFGDRYLRLDRELAAGMAVTIEPGFYQIQAILDNTAIMNDFTNDVNREVLAQFADVRGIRIEDDVLVTAEHPEVLSSVIPKRASEVEDALRAAHG